MKHEIKVEFSDSKSLSELIEKTYFEKGTMGKISGGKENFLLIEESDDVLHTVFKGLNNATVKIQNEVVDGSMRFIIDETQGDVRIYPISIYCVKEHDKYSFY